MTTAATTGYAFKGSIAIFLPRMTGERVSLL